MKSISVLIAIAFGLVATASAEPDLKPSATKVFAEWKDSTVLLTVTRKKAREDFTFITAALCLNQDGLIVAALSRLEQSSEGMMKPVMVMDDAKQDNTPGELELTRVALLAPDGFEVEGELVLRDPELDLAFIQLRKQAEGEDAVTLPTPPAAAGKKAVLLDDLVAINRHGPEFQRVASCALAEVASVIDTPQEFYLPSIPLQGSSAVYDLDGGLVGLATTVKGHRVIVPVTTITQLAQGIKTGEK